MNVQGLMQLDRLQLGSPHSLNGHIYGLHFHGVIDDIRIYNRALSEAEVKELYEFEKPKTHKPPLDN